jgi:site-specific recombinase XerD
MPKFNGTVASLIDCYLTDKDCNYQKLRYATRRYYQALCKKVRKDLGTKKIKDLTARDLLRWHEKYKAQGKVPIGHSVVGMLRTLATFGATLLQSKECRELKALMHDMRFEMPRPRKEILTVEQVEKVIAKAHEMGRPSIALAQAFQFDCMFRQKDVIGEWVPATEPGASDIVSGDWKWVRGIRWEEIDEDMVLTHTTSKRQKEITIDLKGATMVMAELEKMGGRKNKGPIIVNDKMGEPWLADEFRRWWRKIATECRIPSTVKNMDSRAGAISEATNAGVPIEHVRHAATHSDIATTQRYSRDSADKVKMVLQKRVESRKERLTT